MSTPLLEALEMQTENEETRNPQEAPEAIAAESKENALPAEATDSGETASSELELPLWSIVTFQDVAVRGLSYEEALKWMEKLRAQNISGLCIVTDEAAARISET
jgi:hypothetical protein